MTDVVRIEVGVSMTSVNSSTQLDVVEIPREEWEAMDQDARDALINDLADSHLSNHVDAWGRVLGEGE
jgi:hypothetical protein